MRLLPRTTRGITRLAVAAWLVGVALLCHFMPVWPRAEWPLPEAGRFVPYLLPDGRTLLTVQRDEAAPFGDVASAVIRLWDVETGRLQAAYPGGENFANMLIPAAESRWLATLHAANPADDAGPVWTIRVRDADTGQVRSVLTGCFPASCLSPDGRLLAYADAKGGGTALHWWDVEAGRDVATFPMRAGQFAHSLHQARLSFSPDGRRFAAAPDDIPNSHVVRVWDVPSGQELAPLTEPSMTIGQILWSPDGTALAVQGTPADPFRVPGIHVWDLTTGRNRFELYRSHVLVGFAPDGRLITSEPIGADDPCVSWWDLCTYTEKQRSYRHAPGYQCHYFNAFLMPGGRLVLESMLTRSPNRFEEWLARQPRWAAWARLYAIDFRLVDASTGDKLAAWTNSAALLGSHCPPDGRTFINRTGGGRIQVWDVPPRRPLGVFVALTAAWTLPVSALAWWRVRNASAKRR